MKEGPLVISIQANLYVQDAHNQISCLVLLAASPHTSITA